MSVLAFPAAPRTSGPRAPDRRAVYLLDSDPDLGGLLTPSRVTLARRTLRAPVVSVARGPWSPDAAAASTALLVLDGLLVRDVVVADDVAAEIVGPGDFIPAVGDRAGTLPCAVRWTAIATAEIACLDASFTRAMLAFPEIALALMERQRERADRLVALRAIAHLNGVDRRLLALLWLLADRWGRMTADGVVLPMALRHSLMANLVGARRPTVSTALSRLQRRDAVRRRPEGGWILREHAEDVRAEVLTQVPQPRGPVLFPAEPGIAGGDERRRVTTLDERATAARAEATRRIAQLQATVTALRASRHERAARPDRRLDGRGSQRPLGVERHDGSGGVRRIHLAAASSG
jgi:CRP/FNR family transcriptional regulator, cyclic AMP receptor protein